MSPRVHTGGLAGPCVAPCGLDCTAVRAANLTSATANADVLAARARSTSRAAIGRTAARSSAASSSGRSSATTPARTARSSSRRRALTAHRRAEVVRRLLQRAPRPNLARPPRAAAYRRRWEEEAAAAAASARALAHRGVHAAPGGGGHAAARAPSASRTTRSRARSRPRGCARRAAARCGARTGTRSSGRRPCSPPRTSRWTRRTRSVVAPRGGGHARRAERARRVARRARADAGRGRARACLKGGAARRWRRCARGRAPTRAVRAHPRAALVRAPEAGHRPRAGVPLELSAGDAPISRRAATRRRAREHNRTDGAAAQHASEAWARCPRRRCHRRARPRWRRSLKSPAASATHQGLRSGRSRWRVTRRARRATGNAAFRVRRGGRRAGRPPPPRGPSRGGVAWLLQAQSDVGACALVGHQDKASTGTSTSGAHQSDDGGGEKSMVMPGGGASHHHRARRRWRCDRTSDGGTAAAASAAAAAAAAASGGGRCTARGRRFGGTLSAVAPRVRFRSPQVRRSTEPQLRGEADAHRAFGGQCGVTSEGVIGQRKRTFSWTRDGEWRVRCLSVSKKRTSPCDHRLVELAHVARALALAVYWPVSARRALSVVL